MGSAALLLLAWAFWSSLAVGPAVSAEDGNEDLSIVRAEGLEVQAGRLRQIYPEVRKSVADALGWQVQGAPRVLLTADRELFERMSGGPLVSAFAVPRQHTIVMLISPTTSYPSVLHETLEHELCHLVLHDHIGPGLLPRWLDEGICQWLSGSLGEIFAGQGLVTSGSDLARHPIPLSNLARDFPADRPALLKAYEESRLFVTFLVARHGRPGLLRVLDDLQAGHEIDEAVLRAFSKSLPSLEAEWLDGLPTRNLWLIWLSQYLYEMLFFLAALLTVVAFVRSLVRRRAYDVDEEGEE